MPVAPEHTRAIAPVRVAAVGPAAHPLVGERHRLIATPDPVTCRQPLADHGRARHAGLATEPGDATRGDDCGGIRERRRGAVGVRSGDENAQARADVRALKHVGRVRRTSDRAAVRSGRVAMAPLEGEADRRRSRPRAGARD